MQISKNYRLLIISLFSLTLMSCSLRSSPITYLDTHTGKTITGKFSPFFEGLSTLVDEKVTLNAVAKINHNKILPDFNKENVKDQSVKAGLKIHIHNTTPQRIEFLINSIHFENNGVSQYILNEPRRFTLIPDTVERFEEEDYIINTTDREIALIINYTWKEKALQARVLLNRLTTAEIKQRKGPKVY